VVQINLIHFYKKLLITFCFYDVVFNLYQMFFRDLKFIFLEKSINLYNNLATIANGFIYH